MVIRLRVIIISVFVILLSFYNLYALEIHDGNIRLKINKKTGNFSMYYLIDPYNIRYVPLFNDKEPRASLLSVKVDEHVYKLGQTSAFRVRVDNDTTSPVITYESRNILITQVLTPIKTINSQDTNGINMTITVKNTGDKSVSVGLRMLLDTNLGERNLNEHFITNRQIISGETIIDGTSGELFWVSKNQEISLMGSIVHPLDASSRVPDFLYFANWRRLFNVKWMYPFLNNRSFNYRPYSMNDSAVCYFYEPAMLNTGDSFTYTIFLTTEDPLWYDLLQLSNAAGINDEQAVSVLYDDVKDDSDLLLMLMLQETLNKFIDGEIYLNEQDLDEIQRTIDGLR